MAFDPVFSQILALAFAALFANAAAQKVLDFRRFAATLAAYRIAPAKVSALAAPIIVLAEAATAGALLFGPVLLGAALAALLLAAYGGAIWINLARGRDQIDCGCHFGRDVAGVSYALVLRNGVLTGLAMLLLLLPVAPRDLVWLDWVSVAFGVLVAASLFFAAEALIRNAQLWGWSRL